MVLSEVVVIYGMYCRFKYSIKTSSVRDCHIVDEKSQDYYYYYYYYYYDCYQELDGRGDGDRSASCYDGTPRRRGDV